MDSEQKVLDYFLPDDKIAVYPLPIRHQSKLLVYKDEHISHHTFIDLPQLLSAKNLLVFNTTKVVQARLHFKNENGASIEVFCLEPYTIKDPILALAEVAQSEWVCMVGGAKKWKRGKLQLPLNTNGVELMVYAELIERTAEHFAIRFTWENTTIQFADILQIAGELPLPPYLNRKAETDDLERYQTVYAQLQGSVAAPTAGLHFTDTVFAALREKQIENCFVTLHVGAGTFKPIKTENIKEHEMHKELIDIDAKAIHQLLNHVGYIIPVGTTSLRTIESVYWMGVKAFLNNTIRLPELEIQQWDAYNLPQTISAHDALHALLTWMQKNELHRLLCSTQIMIIPGYSIRLAQGIITNFHQPKSTLLLLIAAFVGDAWQHIYEEALAHNYRFLSYGDSSLLMKQI